MFEIVKYDGTYEKQWDNFIEKQSVNGTFLQTRNFLNYHPKDRFEDASLLILQGTSIVAVIPACVVEDKSGKHLFSHKGSTFGGIILERDKYNIQTLEEIFSCLETYLEKNNYTSVTMKQSSDVFCKKNNDLLDYYYFKNDWNSYSELSFYVDIQKSPENLISILSASRRRGYKNSVKNNLYFKKLEHKSEIASFYDILTDNLKKFNQKPVHTLEELYDFVDYRLSDMIDFFGVYTQDGRIVAGTMAFCFDKQVLHTQYLAQSQNEEDKRLYAMEFLNYNTMLFAKEQGYRYFSFGISTENKGKELNLGLATFKEGFGCDFCNNKTYYKSIGDISYVNEK